LTAAGGRKIAWVLMALDYGCGPLACVVDRRYGSVVRLGGSHRHETPAEQ
jgi:hypothetical protein